MSRTFIANFLSRVQITLTNFFLSSNPYFREGTLNWSSKSWKTMSGVLKPWRIERRRTISARACFSKILRPCLRELLRKIQAQSGVRQRSFLQRVQGILFNQTTKIGMCTDAKGNKIAESVTRDDDEAMWDFYRYDIGQPQSLKIQSFAFESINSIFLI